LTGEIKELEGAGAGVGLAWVSAFDGAFEQLVNDNPAARTKPGRRSESIR
jgi:hypothetical protein